MTKHSPSRRRAFARGSAFFALPALLLALGGCDEARDDAPGLTSGAITSESTSPHVVTFMVDDLDARSFELLLDGGYLPNIERYLVDEGVDFRASYTTDSICCPSRATFLSGQYVHNHGVTSVTAGNGAIFPTDPTGQGGESTMLATWLQSAGYQTALFGKYMNGYGQERRRADFTRIPEGWDQWLALYGGTTYEMWGYSYNDNGTTYTAPQEEDDATGEHYQTDFLADRIVSYLEGVDPATPQFLFLTPTAPHVEAPDVPLFGVVNYGTVFGWQIRPAPRHAHLIDGDLSNGELPAQVLLPSFDESDATYAEKAGWMQELVPPMNEMTRAWAARHYQQRLAAMLAVDDLVGAVLGTLESRGMLDDTLVLFTSDNGLSQGEHRLAQKANAFEEAIRVPLVVRPPGGTVASTQCPELVANHDLAATIADYASATSTRTVDGRSFRALVEDASTSWPRERVLIEHYQEGTGMLALDAVWPYDAVRERSALGNFTYVQYVADEDSPFASFDTELYDVAADPYQLDNLAADLTAVERAEHASALAAFDGCSGASCQSAED